MQTMEQHKALVDATVAAIRGLGIGIDGIDASCSTCGRSTYIVLADRLAQIRVSDHGTGVLRHVDYIHVQEMTGVVGIDTMVARLRERLVARAERAAAAITQRVSCVAEVGRKKAERMAWTITDRSTGKTIGAPSCVGSRTYDHEVVFPHAGEYLVQFVSPSRETGFSAVITVG